MIVIIIIIILMSIIIMTITIYNVVLSVHLSAGGWLEMDGSGSGGGGGGKEADTLLFAALQQNHVPVPEEVQTINDIVPRPELLVSILLVMVVNSTIVIMIRDSLMASTKEIRKPCASSIATHHDFLIHSPLLSSTQTSFQGRDFSALPMVDHRWCHTFSCCTTLWYCRPPSHMYIACYKD